MFTISTFQSIYLLIYISIKKIIFKREMIILIQLLYACNVTLIPKMTANELMVYNMVYYIEYCNFQLAVIHCLSIIHVHV